MPRPGWTATMRPCEIPMSTPRLPSGRFARRMIKSIDAMSALLLDDAVWLSGIFYCNRRKGSDPVRGLTPRCAYSIHGLLYALRQIRVVLCPVDFRIAKCLQHGPDAWQRAALYM